MCYLPQRNVPVPVHTMICYAIAGGKNTADNDSLSAKKQLLVVSMSCMLACAVVLSWRYVSMLEGTQGSK